MLEGAVDAGVRAGGTEPAPVGVADPEGGDVVLVGAADAEGAIEVSALAERPKIADIMSPKMLMTRLPVGLVHAQYQFALVKSIRDVFTRQEKENAS